MNDIEFKSTFDKIEFDIAMNMYMKHNSRIAIINDYLGDVYSYKDLEEAKALEEHDTLQEYKKALKEKCDIFDNIIEYIEKVKTLAQIDKVNIFSISTLENILKGSEE